MISEISKINFRTWRRKTLDCEMFRFAARDNADQGMTNMWNQINGLESKISGLSLELNQKNNTIENLRDQLARAQAGPSRSFSWTSRPSGHR